MSESALKILLDLVNQLPLPALLQTEQGEIIVQNQLWQQHCLALHPLPPQEVRKTSAASVAHTVHKHPNRSFSVMGAHLYQEMHVEVSHDGESVWNLSYIPLGNLVRANPPPQTLQAPQAQLLTLLPLTEISPHSAASANILWLLLAQNCTKEEHLTHDLAARNADLVQLNRLKDEFLACITHELKTPLTAILGLSSLLKDHLLGTLNDRQSRYVQMIYQSGRQLMKVVNDILDLTRLETGQIELLREPVNIRHVCDRAISATYQLHSQLKIRNHSDSEDTTTDLSTPSEKNVHLDIEPGLEWLVADEPRLRQMLVNLLSNALKFTQPKDKIGLRVNRWQNWVAFSVWDTGMGIPENKQSLIFQKFQQLEHPLTREFEGLGLGLVITQLLAHLHGGEVSFISKAGAGSTFTILLPDEHWDSDEFSDSSSEKSLPNPAPDHLTELPIVLIAHTQPNDLIQVQTPPGGLNFRVVVAHSGLEALEKTRRLKPAALLLNPVLPLLSGQDVLTILQADPETAKIPAILLGTGRQFYAGSQVQLDSPVTFPLNPTDLQTILDQLLQPPPRPQPTSTQLLTFIRLVDRETLSGLPSQSSPSLSDLLTQALQTLMQSHRCQILEVDDLEQAELMARIWKPQLLLVENLTGLNPNQFLEIVQHSEFLSRLSLISFQPALSALASQLPDLSLYSYPLAEMPQLKREQVKQLVQLLQSVLDHYNHSQITADI